MEGGKDALTGSIEAIKPHTTRLNIVVIVAAAMASFLFGYCNNAVAGTLAQSSFGEQYLSGSDANSRVGGILGG